MAEVSSIERRKSDGPRLNDEGNQENINECRAKQVLKYC
jgi:hypothetical protein